MTTRVSIEFDDDVLEAIVEDARIDRRGLDQWIDIHFKKWLYGAVYFLPPLSKDELAKMARHVRAPVSAKVRGQVFKASDGKCVYCSVELTPFNFQVDHVVPVSKGGKSNVENLVGCCRGCNAKKRNKDVEQFRSERQA